MPHACPKRGKKKRKAGNRWMKHVMKEYRRNKKGGLSAALRRAKKTYRKK